MISKQNIFNRLEILLSQFVSQQFEIKISGSAVHLIKKTGNLHLSIHFSFNDYDKLMISGIGGFIGIIDFEKSIGSEMTDENIFHTVRIPFLVENRPSIENITTKDSKSTMLLISNEEEFQLFIQELEKYSEKEFKDAIAKNSTEEDVAKQYSEIKNRSEINDYLVTPNILMRELGLNRILGKDKFNQFYEFIMAELEPVKEKEPFDKMYSNIQNYYKLHS